jgi:putative flippase GtrA
MNEGDIRQPDLSKTTLISRLKELIKRLWAIRFIRFLVVGGINTLFGYLMYAIFILLHVHYALASLLGTIMGIIFNFFTTGRIVFLNKELKLIFRFFLVYGITYLVKLFFLRIFDSYKIDMLTAGAVLLFPIALLSYSLNKTLVFREIK